MKCNNCGADIRDNTSFCTKCGARTTGVTLPELESGSKNNQIQTYTPPAPAAPMVAKEPEKKKKSIKKPLLIAIAALVVLALGASSFFVIRRNTRSGMPGVSGSVSGSDLSGETQELPALIDPSTPSSSEKELAMKYVRAVEAGEIRDVAALYSEEYCKFRGSDRLSFVKNVDFFFDLHAGTSLEGFKVLSTDNVDDKDYADSLGIPYKKFKVIKMGLDSAEDKQIVFLFAVKDSDGWFILYPSHTDFKEE